MWCHQVSRVCVCAHTPSLHPGVPAFLATAVASAFGAGWRIFISPVDTLKTALQVNGREALALLTAGRWLAS